MQKVKKTKNTERHYLNGKLHREDGPAVINSNGTKEWFVHGVRHRTDGPAVKKVQPYTIDRYFVNGAEYFPESTDIFLRMAGGVVEDPLGTEYWLNYNLHREDGPAVINKYGEVWYNHGKIHRVGAAARCHNDDNGYWSEEWLIDGELHRDNAPAFYDSTGQEFWYQHGNLHRDDGPAWSCPNLDKQWYLNGELHREDGPAIEHEFTHKREWWIKNHKLNVHCTKEFVKHMKMRPFW